MNRLLRSTLNRQTRTYYQYALRGKTAMGNPEEQACPAERFQYLYSPLGPGADQHQGFVYVKKDPYIEHNLYLMDNFMFAYHGQWWHIGSLLCNLVQFTMPLWVLLLVLWQQNANGSKRGSNQMRMLNHSRALNGEALRLKDDLYL